MHQTISVAIVRRALLIVTGMVLYAFIASHLINLMLGLKSVVLMDIWRPWLSGFWSGPITKNILMASLVVHFGLALWSLYRRNTMRVSTYDGVQLACGLLVIPLLAPHVTGIIAAEQLGAPTSYIYLMPYFWLGAPGEGLRQVVLLTIVWLHGSIGIFTWLRAREARRALLIVAYPFFVAVPILALLGYVAAGRQVVPIEMGGVGTAVDMVAAVTSSVQFSPAEVAERILANKVFADRLIFWGSLGVTSRKVVWLFLEQLRLDFVPALHRLQGRPAAQG